MTKAKTNQLIKKILMEGLARSRYDVLKTKLSYPRGGLFANSQDFEEAYYRASSILNTLKYDVSQGEQLTPNQINYVVDVEIAKRSFMTATGNIGIDLATGVSPKAHLQEARDAIEELRKMGLPDADWYERILKEQIGKE